jgi:hypothetical protein
LGQLKYGIYTDDCEGLHPEAIQQYYGVYDGSDSESDSGSDSDRKSRSTAIVKVQQANVRHEGVTVPDQLNPFENQQTKVNFFNLFRQTVESNIVPFGYGLHPDEWGETPYPQVESVQVGKRAGREMQISLADPIWKSCAVLWGQGLHLLLHFVY